MKTTYHLFLLLSLWLLLSCDASQTAQDNATMTPFYIEAGITPQAYNQHNRQYTKKNVDRQPAGLNFHDQRWNTKSKGTVQVANGDYSFTIPNVLSLMGTEDTEHLNEGIYKFSVRSGITPDEFISHDQARIQFMAMLRSLVALGWQPIVSHSEPRLSGKQAIKYAIQNMGADIIDPQYTPALNEWMEIDSDISCAFHANNVFLDVGFRRNLNYMDKNGEGVYLLNFTLTTKETIARSHFSGNEREQWQTLWVDTMKKLKLIRYQKEVELIKQGYHINTQYVDPVIHPQDPVEPDGEEADALRTYIQQHNNP